MALFTHKILNGSTNIPTIFHRALTRASEILTHNTRFDSNLNFHRPKKSPYTSLYNQYKLYLLNTQSCSSVYMQSAYMYFLHMAYLCYATLLCFFFFAHVYNFLFCTFLISTAVIDKSCQLFVRVSDQHESLCYFGH